MGRNKGEPNADCAECGKRFHCASSLLNKLKRCTECRKGKQGKRVNAKTKDVGDIGVQRFDIQRDVDTTGGRSLVTE